jgi:hypothetical protein
MQKVLLIVIDALTDRLLRPLLDEGRLSNLAAIRDRGQIRTSTSIFPSITHACLSSIATGVYPQQHHVLGAHWYLPDENSEAYYGTDPDIIFSKGVDDFFQDFMVDLNGTRLNAMTVFEALEEKELTTAALNFMIYKGAVQHDVNLPFLMKMVPGIDDDGLTVKGPQTLYLGEFVQSSAPELPELEVRSGPGNWFGFKDENTAYQLIQLAQERAFPSFTLAYFPENDYRSHSQGPQEGHVKLEELDAALGKMFEVYGGIDQFLTDIALVITGDHSQSDIRDDGEAAISLEKLFAGDFGVAMAGEPWDSDFELLACPNLRAAQIYFKDPAPEIIRCAIKTLRSDERIDQVIWRADSLDDDSGYVLVQGDIELHFAEGDKAEDRYGNRWTWKGDLSTVGGKEEDGRLDFGDYPNAFERIRGILNSPESGKLWVTAQPGYEFETPLVGVHNGGGSHGSLHFEDSLSSLIVAGPIDDYELPNYPRLVDIKPICFDLVGLD